jgi:hypothetical protein
MPYAEALDEAVCTSQILLLVFSSNSNRSGQVMREVEGAVDKGIAILPFRIEDVQPDPPGAGTVHSPMPRAMLLHSTRCPCPQCRDWDYARQAQVLLRHNLLHPQPLLFPDSTIPLASECEF